MGGTHPRHATSATVVLVLVLLVSSAVIVLLLLGYACPCCALLLLMLLVTLKTLAAVSNVAIRGKILYTTLSMLAEDSSTTQVYEANKQVLIPVQTVAILEFVHALLGIVRTNAFTTLLQVSE